MVRSADPPGADKHLRFGIYTEELSQALIGFPGVKSIVLHTHGAKGEHPHLHVWWSDAPVTNQTIRNRLKQYNPIFNAMKSQNDWSFRNHESYETWAAYVQRNKTHKVLHGELPPPKDIIELVLPTPKTPLIPNPTIPIKVRRPTAEERLKNYCLTEAGFKYNQWTLIHFEEPQYLSEIHKKVGETILAYSNGRLSPTQQIYVGRNVIWTFSDPDARDHLARQWTLDVKKYW